MDLDEYFRIKDAHESKIKRKKDQIIRNSALGDQEKRQRFEHIKYECIQCKKEGGTAFKQDKTAYYAKCNASPPCELDVKIERERVKNIYAFETHLEEELREIQKEIIETNMDLVYKFVTEDDTQKRGDTLRKRLKQTTDELVAVRRTFERNTEKLEESERTMQSEIKAMQASETGHADLYVSTIRPLAEQIRLLKYKQCVIEPSSNDTHVLVQHTRTMDDLYK